MRGGGALTRGFFAGCCPKIIKRFYLRSKLLTKVLPPAIFPRQQTGNVIWEHGEWIEIFE